jgi:hypothetical protein
MTAAEKKNLDFVMNWWREVIESRHTEPAEKYRAEDYIQHNPNVPTGRAAFVRRQLFRKKFGTFKSADVSSHATYRSSCRSPTGGTSHRRSGECHRLIDALALPSGPAFRARHRAQGFAYHCRVGGPVGR